MKTSRALILGVLLVGITSKGSAVNLNDGLTYGETGRVDNVDPYTSHEAQAQRLADLLFDALVTTNAQGEYSPALAESWDVAENRTSVTFSLRKNVFWHDGKPFTGADLKNTVRLITNKASEIPNRERFDVLGGIDEISEGRVRLKFNRAVDDPLRYALFKILPAHLLGQAASVKRDLPFNRKPIGTGPYSIVKTGPQGEVLLKANEKYFLGAPRIKQIILKAYVDQSIMAQSLMYKAIDLVTYVSPRDFAEVAGDRHIQTLPYDALSFTFLGLNTNRGLLKDKRVRQAIAYGVNREEMLKAFFANHGRLISGPFPPTSWAYNVDVKNVDFSSEKAKQLLATAGLKDEDHNGVLETTAGKEFALQLSVPISGESETIKKVALAFQNYMKDIGVKVDLKFVDWLVWKKVVLEQHDYDITIASWSFDDATNITSLFHSSSAKAWGNNFVMFQNTQVDKLLTEADTTNDFDKRRLIYHKLHGILADETPYVYLWTLTHHAAYRDRLSSIRVEPFAFFKYVNSWQVKEVR